MSGRQALAATVAACGNDAAAALGGHARTETVTALADEFRGLIGALHLFEYRGVRPFFVLSLMNRSVSDRTMGTKTIAPDGRPKRGRAYRKKARRSQSRYGRHALIGRKPVTSEIGSAALPVHAVQELVENALHGFVVFLVGAAARLEHLAEQIVIGVA